MARTPENRGGPSTRGLDDYGRSYRAGKRLTRWPVGTVYAGEVKPSGAPCTIVFPDVLPNAVEAFVRGFTDEVGRNRLLVGLPILGVTHVAVNLDRRAFLVLPPVAEAESVEERVRTHGPLAPLVALQIAVMLADALARLHYRVRAVGEIRPWQVVLPADRRQLEVLVGSERVARGPVGGGGVGVGDVHRLPVGAHVPGAGGAALRRRRVGRAL